MESNIKIVYFPMEDKFSIWNIERYIHETEDYFGEKLDLVVIDYAGLIKFEGGSLYEQQSGIAKDLKALAGRTDTGIITLAQVSKQYKDEDPLDLDSTH